MSFKPLSLLDEIKRSESIPAGQGEPPPFLKLPPPSSSLSSKPVEKTQATIPQHKVAIPEPSEPGSFMYHLLNINASSERLQKGAIEMVKGEFESKTKSLEELQKKQVAKMVEVAQEVEKKQTYAFWSGFASCFISAGTIVVGGGMIATGDSHAIKAGACLVASGISGLLSLTLSDMGTSDYLVATTALISASFGIVGGGLSLYYDIPKNLAQNIGMIAVCAMNFTKGSSEALEASTNYKAGHLQAELAFFQHTSEQKKREMQKEVTHFEYSQKLTQHTEALSKALETYRTMIHQITQQVV